MCGLSGFLDFNLDSNLSTLKKMTDVLTYRGPDDSGYYFNEFTNYQVGLGHRRLSILDLSKQGKQPIIYNHLTIVYNGEVYNFKEIRTELEKLNYFFDSQSDTEVIIKAFDKWGIKMVDRLNGMFSIAIFNSKSQKLTLIRDRAGVKPLYWYYKDGFFMFSSELKSFHEHEKFKNKINPDGLALFFQYGYIPQPHTIFENSYKLKAGHYLEFDIVTNNLKIEEYWNVIDCYSLPKLKISETEILTETEKLLKASCEYRMVSDVPVGVFLSGGYDSSLVTALLQSERTERLKTFTIGYHEVAFNEAQHAKRVANYLGTDHTEYYCTQKDALDILPQLPEIWDEPFGDPSVIPTILVSKIAKNDVTVALSADGGDEIFGGYNKYTGIKNKLDVFNNIPNFIKPTTKYILNSNATHKLANKFHMYDAKSRLNRFALMLDKNEREMLKINSQSFSNLELKELFLLDFKGLKTEFDTQINLPSWLDNILAIDYKTYQLDNILTKVDRATMSVSLEGREPLLDYNIIDFVARIDSNLKINKGCKKYLLKEITHKYLPKKIMDRPKMGFGVPIFDWFKDDLKDHLTYYLNEKRIQEGGLFNPKEVIRIRDNYLNGVKTNINKVWLLLVFEMWRERWL